ncbi:GH39 family glycosyl hydrolase [Niallia sp. MER 6]|uniref:GH39 family glycosyl hydrolase n=1 Tax=Niallia sp. MER 6 TaxID=2939567 RepID=UPI00203DC949|nr:helix-turn-helix domain-containing protein [Niallia sp. MER 6]MCM3030714.1 helix-turn-helix domain-containing protein [Niallia sp. MER 6]
MFNTQTVQTSIDSKIIAISVMHGNSTLDHVHKDIEIIYVIKGNLQVKANNKTTELNKSDFLLVNSNELHSFHSDSDNLFIVFHLNYLQTCSLLGQENPLFQCNSIEQIALSHQKLRSSLDELLAVYLNQRNSSMVFFLEKVFNVISILQLEYLKDSRPLEKRSYTTENGQNERLVEILEYIENNFREPLSLEEVASIQYITVPYLSKFFKKQTGKTFSEYVNKVRVAHAVNELIYTNKSITRIALDNGFPNLAAFNRVFNERFQVKPIEYRKQHIEPKEQHEILKEDKTAEKKEAFRALRTYLEDVITADDSTKKISEEKDIIVKLGKMDAFTKYWNKTINIGYATDILSSDMQEQITFMQNEIGFTYARFWGLFSDEMHVEDYSKDNSTYNFTNINKLLDFLIKNRLKPFIELGPKPKIVSKSFEHTITFQTNSKRSLEEWKKLLRAFLLHCIERYSIEEVETWYFEIWSNEIDPIHNLKNPSNNFVKNIRHDPGQFEGYFNIFSCLKQTVNEIVSSAKVGGCGLPMDLEREKLDKFFRQWKLNGVMPDFLSIYLYSIEVDSDRNVPKKNMLSTNPDYMKMKLKQVRESMLNAGFDNMELNVTEWNISISNRDYLNDSCFKAAYIVKNIVDNIKQNVNMMGYWMFSDIFSDFRDAKNLLHGGAGLVTKNGIRKPGYHAFVLLKHLGEILVAKGPNYIITKKSGDRYQIICFNYKHFDYSYYLHPEGSTDIKEQYDIFENNDKLTISLEIQGVTKGEYRMKEQILNREQGSVLDEWLNFGSVYDMKPDEVGYLKRRCVPSMKVDHIYVENNAIKITAELKPHEIRLYELNLLYRE